MTELDLTEAISDDRITEWRQRLSAIKADASTRRQVDFLVSWIRDEPYLIDALLGEVERMRAITPPRKVEAIASLVRSATRLVQIERDDARAEVERLTRELKAARSHRESLLALCDKAAAVVTPPWVPILSVADIRRALGVTE